MKRRIGLWALCGSVVASVWLIIGLLTRPNYNLGRSTFVAVTAPASLLGRAMPLAYDRFILLNAGIFALAGLTIELLRRPFFRRFAD